MVVARDSVHCASLVDLLGRHRVEFTLVTQPLLDGLLHVGLHDARELERLVAAVGLHSATPAELVEADAPRIADRRGARLTRDARGLRLLVPLAEHAGAVGKRFGERACLELGRLPDGRARSVEDDSLSVARHGSDGDRLLLVERRAVGVGGCKRALARGS